MSTWNGWVGFFLSGFVPGVWGTVSRLILALMNVCDCMFTVPWWTYTRNVSWSSIKYFIIMVIKPFVRIYRSLCSDGISLLLLLFQRISVWERGSVCGWGVWRDLHYTMATNPTMGKRKILNRYLYKIRHWNGRLTYNNTHSILTHSFIHPGF